MNLNVFQRALPMLLVITLAGCTSPQSKPVSSPTAAVAVDNVARAAAPDVDAPYFEDSPDPPPPMQVGMADEPTSALMGAIGDGPLPKSPELIDIFNAIDSLAATENYLRIYVFAIGQANSTLFIGSPPENRTLLVDAGEVGWKSSRNCQILRERITEIVGEPKVDYLLITHYHTDHSGHPGLEEEGRYGIGGGVFCLLNDPSEQFRIGTIVHSGDEIKKWRNEPIAILDALTTFMPTWKKRGRVTSDVVAQFGFGQIDLGPGIAIDVVAMNGRVSSEDPGAIAIAAEKDPSAYKETKGASPNDFSIAAIVSLGDFELFFGGDLSGAAGDPPYKTHVKTRYNEIYTNVESHMVTLWRSSETSRESDVEVYMANHHGSGNSSTLDLTEALSPELVIYSCGGGHNHPDRDIVDRLKAADQIITSDWSEKEWKSGFPPEYGNGWENPVGEIRIAVPSDGKRYTVSSDAQIFIYEALSDHEEATR